MEVTCAGRRREPKPGPGQATRVSLTVANAKVEGRKGKKRRRRRPKREPTEIEIAGASGGPGEVKKPKPAGPARASLVFYWGCRCFSLPSSGFGGPAQVSPTVYPPTLPRPRRLLTVKYCPLQDLSCSCRSSPTECHCTTPHLQARLLSADGRLLTSTFTSIR